MMPRDGFLNLLKPPGITSHDVVARVRRHLGIRRAGHLGTLDPAAAGVLPVALGRATRLFQYAAGGEKDYRAEIVFGTATDTLDAEGRVVATADAGALTAAQVQQLLAGFTGTITQTPPSFSAVHIGGKRLHELARSGAAMTGRPRPVQVSSLALVEFAPGRRAQALLDITCSAGTYIRVLAADLGQAADLPAHLRFLVRTRVGRFRLPDALSPEEFATACSAGEATTIATPPDWPLCHLAAVHLEARAAVGFVAGRRVACASPSGWPLRVYGPGERFLGLGEVLAERQLRPRLVLASEEGLRQ